MRVVALLSGGKDSCFNMMQCVANGHEIVALANLQPPSGRGEMDSYMYQTTGAEALELLAQAMELPLFRQVIRDTPGGGATLAYTPHSASDCEAEVEDLGLLLDRVCQAVPNVEAVAAGAILSDYQRNRVEHVCVARGLVPLAYLWRQEQAALLQTMLDAGLEAVVIKTAAIGLGRAHLGATLGQLQPLLLRLNSDYGSHVCGEGGEYETLTVDCPLFKRRIRLVETAVVSHSDDAFAPVLYLKVIRAEFEPKTDSAFGFDAALLRRRGIAGCGLEDIVAFSNSKDLKSDAPSVRLGAPGKEPVAPRLAYDVIVGAGVTFEDQAASVLAQLAQSRLSFRDVALVTLPVADMSVFATLNARYAASLSDRPDGALLAPPPRACIEVPIDGPVALRVLARNGPACGRQFHMHVQSRSYWAPANIGPYAQALGDERDLFFAGMIGLDPASMDMAPADRQVAQSLKNMAAVFDASNVSLSQTASCICYVTDVALAPQAQSVWAAAAGPRAAPLAIAVVSALPRSACIEWQLTAAPKAPRERQSSIVEYSAEWFDGAVNLQCLEQPETGSLVAFGRVGDRKAVNVVGKAAAALLEHVLERHQSESLVSAVLLASVSSLGPIAGLGIPPWISAVPCVALEHGVDFILVAHVSVSGPQDFSSAEDEQ